MATVNRYSGRAPRHSYVGRSLPFKAQKVYSSTRHRASRTLQRLKSKSNEVSSRELYDRAANEVGGSSASGEVSESLDRIRVGTNQYLLKRVFVARYSQQTGEYRIDSFSTRFAGHGETLFEARNDWRNQIHSRFQQLVRSRPFRMSEDEKADWAILSELIDVEHYWKTTPFRHLETGWISSVGSGAWEITWLGVDGTERIRVENVPDEFAGYQKDQWFEALVERDRDAFTLRRIIDCRAIDPIEDMTDEEVEAWFSSLPTTETLPKSDTDWNTL